jgi:uncharacterized membrane protein YhdT
MPLTFTHALLQAEPIHLSAYLPWVAMGLLCVGALGWLIAAVLGFARARAFGDSPRWFAIASVCLLLYHVQWLVLAIYGIVTQSVENLINIVMFFNLFVALGALCAIVGFMRLTGPRE